MCKYSTEGNLTAAPHPPKAPALALVAAVAAAAASQVTLAIQCRGEGLVVKGTRDGVGALVWCHAGNAVLCLVRRKLSPQLLSRDVVLNRREREEGLPEWGVHS